MFPHIYLLLISFLELVKLLCLSLGSEQGLLFPSLLSKQRVTGQRSDQRPVIKLGPRLQASSKHGTLAWTTVVFKAKTLSLNLNASWKRWRKKGFQPGPLSEVPIQGVTGTPFFRSWSGRAAGCWDQQWEVFHCCSQQWTWWGAEVPASFVVLFWGEVSLSNHMNCGLRWGGSCQPRTHCHKTLHRELSDTAITCQLFSSQRTESSRPKEGTWGREQCVLCQRLFYLLWL